MLKKIFLFRYESDLAIAIRNEQDEERKEKRKKEEKPERWKRASKFWFPKIT